MIHTLIIAGNVRDIVAQEGQDRNDNVAQKGQDRNDTLAQKGPRSKRSSHFRPESECKIHSSHAGQGASRRRLRWIVLLSLDNLLSIESALTCGQAMVVSMANRTWQQLLDVTQILDDSLEVG